jgi:hypothetical protein
MAAKKRVNANKKFFLIEMYGPMADDGCDFLGGPFDSQEDAISHARDYVDNETGSVLIVQTVGAIRVPKVQPIVEMFD